MASFMQDIQRRVLHEGRERLFLIVSLISFIWLAYQVGLVIHRLYFHPLRKIPGPKFAAASFWYEFYHDVVLDGHFTKQYAVLHKKYGPIIRVSPERVHVDDPEFYHRVYCPGSKYLKDPGFYALTTTTDGLGFLTDPGLHRQRRGVVNPVFSTMSLRNKSPLLFQNLEIAFERVKDAHIAEKPLDMQDLAMRFTVDMISKVCFGMDMGALSASKEGLDCAQMLHNITPEFFLLKHFPLLAQAITALPDSILGRLVPGLQTFRTQCVQWIKQESERRSSGLVDEKYGQKTIWNLILEDKHEKRTQRQLVDEAFTFMFAGTDTTATAMTVVIFYILKHPSIYKRLQQELDTAKRNRPDFFEYDEVMNLPYLSAIVKEALRIMPPGPGNFPRLVPPGGTTYDNYYLPANTVVSTTIWAVLNHPAAYPEPEKFLPDRWLGESAQKSLDNMVAFGRGARNCIGQNMAYMEVHLVVANLLSCFDLRLADDTEKKSGLEWKDRGLMYLADKCHVVVTGVR